MGSYAGRDGTKIFVDHDILRISRRFGEEEAINVRDIDTIRIYRSSNLFLRPCWGIEMLARGVAHQVNVSSRATAEAIREELRAAG